MLCVVEAWGEVVESNQSGQPGSTSGRVRLGWIQCRRTGKWRGVARPEDERVTPDSLSTDLNHKNLALYGNHDVSSMTVMHSDIVVLYHANHPKITKSIAMEEEVPFIHSIQILGPKGEII